MQFIVHYLSCSGSFILDALLFGCGLAVTFIDAMKSPRLNHPRFKAQHVIFDDYNIIINQKYKFIIVLNNIDRRSISCDP